MSKVTGKGGISAKIVADSISAVNKQRLTTFELEYHRYIHSEVMTHRILSKNAASSRAVPVERAIQHIRDNTAMPIHWGKKQAGMQAKEECDNPVSVGSDGFNREDAWLRARDYAIGVAEAFDEAKYHKQIVNRLTEPFTMIKIVCTGTEFDNLFWLRDHLDAQPEIQELARCMLEAMNNSTPVILQQDDWHTPYYGDGYWKADLVRERYSGTVPTATDDWAEDFAGNTLADAIAVSSSCAAQVSYRRLDDSLEKAKDIYKRLVESEPCHMSPFEHCGTPIDDFYPSVLCDGKMFLKYPSEWPKGVTHIDSANNVCSGNLKNWIQYRQLIPNNACWDYENLTKYNRS